MSSVLSRSSEWMGSIPERPESRARNRSMAREHRQFRWLVLVGFLLLLVPAALARLSGWRWRPWPPGREGYRSVVGEAREAAETYIVFAFLGW